MQCGFLPVTTSQLGFFILWQTFRSPKPGRLPQKRKTSQRGKFSENFALLFAVVRVFVCDAFSWATAEKCWILEEVQAGLSHRVQDGIFCYSTVPFINLTLLSIISAIFGASDWPKRNLSALYAVLLSILGACCFTSRKQVTKIPQDFFSKPYSICLHPADFSTSPFISPPRK